MARRLRHPLSHQPGETILREWFCANTNPKAEHLATRELRAAGFDVFLPLGRSSTQLRGYSPSIASPLFPSYLFVAFDLAEDPWVTVNLTRGVRRLMPVHAEQPSSIPADIIEALQAQADDLGILDVGDAIETVIRHVPGSLLKVLEGPFQSFVGQCVEHKGQRVALLLGLFGRPPVKISLRSDQVLEAPSPT